MGLGRNVEDNVRLVFGQQLRHHATIGNVSALEVIAWVIGHPGEIFEIPRISQRVKIYDPVAASDQSFDNMRSDETGAAGDKNGFLFTGHGICEGRYGATTDPGHS